MRSCPIYQRTPRAVVAVVLPLLCLTPASWADTLPEPTPAAPASQPLTIQACRQIALANQPTILATRAALQAALDRQQALECLRVPTCLARDLPIRRKQAALGVTIAQAGIVQAEAETLHGISVGYLGVLYASQQLRLTEDTDPVNGIRGRLDALQELVNDLLKKKERADVTLQEHRNLVQSFLDTLAGRAQEAKQGKLRGLAAMREAMGVGPDFVIEIANRDLPCPRVKPQLNELIALALARRGELIQSATLAEVICLEMDAQATSCRSTFRTFASGSDIHAKPVPSGDLGGVNFRPSIVGPDMPVSLTGSRDARVQQAHDYCERAKALTAKTRNLIALEVEDLYRRWVDKSERATQLEKAFRQARKFSERMKQSFNRAEPGYPNVDEVINAGLITTRLQLEWKEAHYQALLALAALERATAGGFAVDFDTAPSCEGEEKETNGDSNGQR